MAQATYDRYRDIGQEVDLIEATPLLYVSGANSVAVVFRAEFFIPVTIHDDRFADNQRQTRHAPNVRKRSLVFTGGNDVLENILMAHRNAYPKHVLCYRELIFIKTFVNYTVLLITVSGRKRWRRRRWR